MSVVVSHPTGNANTRAVLRGLQARGLLAGFHTTLALPPGPWAARLFGETRARKLDQRRFPELPWAQQHLHPWPEALRLFARVFGPVSLIRHETGMASVDAVYAAVDRTVARSLTKGGIKAVYAYDDGALHSFRAAKVHGITRIYDLPIAHWRSLRRLLSEEAERHPDWAATMPGLSDSMVKLERKDEEIATAEHILVASRFTRDSLTEHFGPECPVRIVPYGCPAPLVAEPARRAPGAALEILYAGHLSQRKGVADLIVALDLLTVDWRLTMAGPKPAIVPAALDRLLKDPRCTWLGTVPHRTLLERMTRAHVFVFPSIVEGFGMVLTEAMAAGLPVITTPHTAGPDLLTPGVDGLLVPIRAPEALARELTRLADDEDLRHAMACNSLATAARSGWDRYEARVAAHVAEWIA